MTFKAKEVVELAKKKFNVAPLSGGFMVTSIVGFLISVVYVYPQSARWGFTFGIFFALMFMASMISMTYGPDAAQLHIGARKKK
jgi:formate hydrogenlyase subunit 3/multisubunit Na+/H+ antiporter MnhD subunit